MCPCRFTCFRSQGRAWMAPVTEDVGSHRTRENGAAPQARYRPGRMIGLVKRRVVQLPVTGACSPPCGQSGNMFITAGHNLLCGLRIVIMAVGAYRADAGAVSL